ncbi:hypothetical protein JW960_27890 [candidate division KSB1 bacterium]|nr:hypothetical protein [candidate division KSB1 bacterium]
MKKGLVILLPIFMLATLITCNKLSHQSLTVFYQPDVHQQIFAMEKLGEIANLKTAANANNANLIVIVTEELNKQFNVQADYQAITAEGFSLKRLGNEKLAIIARDQTGAMYGILELAEQLHMGKTIQTVSEKSVNPQLPFRAIKFNLPWYSYRMHESLQLHDSTCRDLNFWKAFLDQMAENRFNALTLWNMHPFTYMIRAKNFPEACPFSDDELKQWQHFWHSLFGMAKDRGIKTYMINWNIFVSPEFAQAHNVADYCLPEMLGKGYYGKGDYSPIIQKYTRESMTQLINEYPELTGFGVSQNERMQGVDEQIWQDWIVDTYFDAMDSADHKIEFIMRAHTHPAPELTRKALEDNAYRLGTMYVPVKFNWSHAHGCPRLMYIHGGSRSKSLWEPTPKNYKMVFTMRNEDFFVLRWGQPDFVRDVLAENNQNYIGGFMIGSECLIPAKEYITKPGPYLTWKYAFEKQWLFYMVWGRLLYDPTTSDDVFANAFNQKYNIDFGDKLVAAHKLADKMPLKLASYYAGSWDFTLYSEGFLAGYVSNMGPYYDYVSPFISVDEIIRTITLDDRYLSIEDYINGNNLGPGKITPLQLADELEHDGNDALAIISALKTNNPTLQHEIDDIHAWALLSLYFSEKMRGGIALQSYRVHGASEKQTESIQHLESALAYWEKLVTITSHYIDDIPLLHLGDEFNNGGNARNQARFSWANFTDEVRNDIEIAKTSSPVK